MPHHRGRAVEQRRRRGRTGRSSPQDVVRVLSALSDVNRFRIVELLSSDGVELSCGAICGSLGLSPSLLSHHLAVLEGAGLIDRRRNGLWTLNRLRRDELRRRLTALQRIVRPEDATPLDPPASA